MSHLVFQDNLSLEIDYLHKVVGRQASKEAFEWLEDVLFQLVHKKDNSNFYNAFRQAPVMLGKEKVELTENSEREADMILKGLKPREWNLTQAGRVLLLVALPHDGVNEYLQILDNLFSTASLEELITLYTALPLLLYPEKHVERAKEGVRSNITAVFDAIALNNPYPARCLDENAWNQMVLKAVYIGRPLNEICGFDERRNSNLAKKLLDYAHERWAVNSTVTPELWRAVGPFLTEKSMAYMKKLFDSNDQLNKEAAALACSESKVATAKKLLEMDPKLSLALGNKDVCWKKIGETYNNNIN